MVRPLTILLAALMTLGVLLGNPGGLTCHSADHDHPEVARAECGHGRCGHHIGLAHDDSGHHDGHCHCHESRVFTAAMVLSTRAEGSQVRAGLSGECDHWRALVVANGVHSTGPPRAPPWLDPGREQALAVVASVRLII